MLNFFVILTGGTGGHVLPSVSFGNYLIENILTTALNIKCREQNKTHFFLRVSVMYN